MTTKQATINLRGAMSIATLLVMSLAITPGASAQEQFLVGWHTPDLAGGSNPVSDVTPDTATINIGGALGFPANGGFEVRDTFNSTDNTFGSLAIPGSPTTNNAVILRTASDQTRRLDVTFTNDTGFAIVLDALHFDFGRGFPDGPRTLNASVLTDHSDLDIDGSPLIFSSTNTPVLSSEISDYADADADLSALPDRILAPGESVAFRIEVADANGQFVALVVDNIALSGTFLDRPGITIETTNVLAPLAGRTAGLNTLYTNDDQSQRNPGALTLTQALDNIGSNALRYPGGEVSDNFIWSKNLDGQSPPTLLEASGSAFITDFPGLWDFQNNQFTDLVLDFDEFMAIAQATDSTVVVCLPFDRMFNDGGTTVSPPFKNFLINNAISMITYARNQGYHVDYWQLGNESYLNKNRQDARSNDGPATPQIYAQYFLEFAQAIETALGPDYDDVNLAANGHNFAWVRDIFDVAAVTPHIDMITPHTYEFGVADFEDYVQNRTNLIINIEETRDGLNNASISQTDRDRIRIGVTEFGAFRLEGFDPDTDPRYDQGDIARAIMLFEKAASLLREPDLDFIMHWVTRWIANQGDPLIHATDTFDDLNQPTPNGIAQQLLYTRLAGAFVGVAVDSALDRVNAYAIWDDANNTIHAYLVNRSPSAQEVAIRTPPGLFASSSETVEYFSDDGTPYDISPTLRHAGPSPVLATGEFPASIEPYSITLVSFAPCSSDDVHPPFGSLDTADLLEFELRFNAGDETFRAAPVDSSDFLDWMEFLNTAQSPCSN